MRNTDLQAFPSFECIDELKDLALEVEQDSFGASRISLNLEADQC
jgi:hypothetical protein